MPSSDARAVETVATASDAFQALAGDPRVAVIRALAAGTTGRATFTELFEATDVDTTAGFAYHLRQLDDHYVRQVDSDSDAAGDRDGPDDDASRYELTAAGRRVARALDAGAYTRRIEDTTFPVPDPCPRCDAGRAAVDDDTVSPESSETHPGTGLRGEVADDVASVRCEDCDHEPVTVPITPAVLEGESRADLSDTVDAIARRRLRSYADGVCPDCGGDAQGRIVAESSATGDASPSRTSFRARFACANCSATLSCPPSHVLLVQPAVVTAYHDHGVDVRDRPLWAVDDDWRTITLSTDPWCLWLALADPGDGDDDDDDSDDVLGAYLDGDLDVAGVERLDDADGDARGRITPDVADDATPEESPSEDGTPA